MEAKYQKCLGSTSHRDEREEFVGLGINFMWTITPPPPLPFPPRRISGAAKVRCGTCPGCARDEDAPPT